MSRRRVVLVDDHALFRGGLSGLLERYADVDIVGEATDGDEFVEMIESGIEVDIVFMDISMERVSGDVATRKALALRPDLKIITLSMFGDEHYYSRMVKAGARGFLLKNSDINEVIEAMDIVSEGGEFFSAELLKSISTNMRTTNRAGVAEDILSSRENEILVGVCQGLSNQEIADKLFISKRTVDKHRANIMEKTGCKNTANLVIYAIKNHLIDF